MKTAKAKIGTAAGAMLAALTLAAGAAQAGDVVVELRGVQARGGQVLATLQTRDVFMGVGGLAQKQTAKEGSLFFTFKDVPPGDYAFSAMHDEDGDGKLKMAPSGMPAEGVGMVGGEQLRGPPTFDVVKFSVPAGEVRHAASLMYFDGKIPTN